jgi:hypothetical protein
MPTKDWKEEDLSTVIAEAYVYQSYFVKWKNACFVFFNSFFVFLYVLFHVYVAE